MMARFFDYGDGSGASAVEYLLAEEVAAYTEDRKRLPDQTFRPYVLPELIADVELHFLIPRVELYGNRSFNPAPLLRPDQNPTSTFLKTTGMRAKAGSA